MIERISQSFMKNFREYLAGDECGHIIKAKYVDGIEIELDSDSVHLGTYFEFITFGTLPKNGRPPQPGMMKSGKDMLAPYRKAHENSKRLKEYLQLMGLKVISAGKRLVKGRFEGTIDLEVECEREIHFSNGIVWRVGDRLVIDLKYSGLIDDWKSKHGWQFSNIQKEYHGTQAKQYHYVSGGKPFYFLVMQNNASEDEVADIRLIHTPVDSVMVELHLSEGNQLFDRFKTEELAGFVPHPSLSRCMKCKIREGCEDKHVFPHPSKVDLNIE